MSLGSSHLPPMNETPTGIPNAAPAVTVMVAYPAIAAGDDEPIVKWSPLIRSVVHIGSLVGAMIASRSLAAIVSSIACWAMDVAVSRASM